MLSTDEFARYKKYSNDTSDFSISWSVLFGVLAILVAVLLLPIPFHSRMVYALGISALSAFSLVMLRNQKIKECQRAVQPTSLDDCSHQLHLHQMFASKTCPPMLQPAGRSIDVAKPAEIKVGDVGKYFCSNVGNLSQRKGCVGSDLS